MRTASILLSLFLLSSCITEIPVELPKGSPKLAVGCFIYPDKLVSLNVSYLKLFSDTIAPEAPKILDITIKEDGVIIDHPKGQGPEIYTSTYPKVGSVYELSVTTDRETATATAKIPSKVPIIKADHWRSFTPNQDGDFPMMASVSWNDPAGPNFYELIIGSPSPFYRPDAIVDPVLQQEADLDYWPSTFIFSDKQFEGKTYTMTLPYGVGNRDYAILRNLSEEYYHYKKSWYRHLYLQNISTNVETIKEDFNIFPLLFQGDPIPLFCNIENGLGIFAGYNEDKLKFKTIR